MKMKVGGEFELCRCIDLDFMIMFGLSICHVFSVFFLVVFCSFNPFFFPQVTRAPPAAPRPPPPVRRTMDSQSSWVSTELVLRILSARSVVFCVVL